MYIHVTYVNTIWTSTVAFAMTDAFIFYKDSDYFWDSTWWPHPWPGWDTLPTLSGYSWVWWPVPGGACWHTLGQAGTHCLPYLDTLEWGGQSLEKPAGHTLGQAGTAHQLILQAPVQIQRLICVYHQLYIWGPGNDWKITKMWMFSRQRKCCYVWLHSKINLVI